MMESRHSKRVSFRQPGVPTVPRSPSGVNGVQKQLEAAQKQAECHEGSGRHSRTWWLKRGEIGPWDKLPIMRWADNRLLFGFSPNFDPG
jgi:hypothetical protein